MKRLLLALAGSLLIAGCGSDATGPGNTVSVAGTWDFSASNLSGAGVSCAALGLVLQISQTGSTFSGSYSGGTMQCSGPGGTVSGAISSGTVVNGSINGTSVQFDLDTQDLHEAGSVSGNSMSGSATWRFDLGAPTGVVVLSGNWSAARR